MLTTIRMFDELGARFGRVRQLDVSDTAEAIRALCRLVPGFERFMMQSGDRGIDFVVRTRNRNLTPEELRMQPGEEIYIVPVLRGAKNGGIANIILGTVLIVASFFVPGGAAFAAALLNAGVAIALGGVVQLLSPQPKDGKSKDKPENEPNYAFNGPVNTQAQGNCVPVMYGDGWAGSAVISAGINVGDAVYIPATSSTQIPTLIATGPDFYYPVQGDLHDHMFANGTFQIYSDNPGNLPTYGGVGMQFAEYQRIQTSGSAGLSVTPAGGHSVLCRTRYDGVVSGSGGGLRNIVGCYNNSIFMDCYWALQLRGPNLRTPCVIVANSAGGGVPLLAPFEITAGQTFDIGFRWTQATNLLELLVNGSVVASGSRTFGVQGAGGGAPQYVNGMSSGANWKNYGYFGSTGHVIGWNSAISDAIGLAFSNDEGWLETAGEGDGWLQEETEV